MAKLKELDRPGFVTVFPAAVLVVFGGLALKVSSVSCGKLTAIDCAVQIAAGDLPLIGAVIGLVCAAPLLRTRLLRLVFLASALAFSWLYLLDSYLIRLFNQRLGIDDLIKYSGGLEIILSFVGPVHLAAAAALVILSLLRIGLLRKVSAAAALIGIFALFSDNVLSPTAAQLLRFTTSPLSILQAFIAGPSSFAAPYTQAQVEFYSKQFPPQVEVSTPVPGVNVILLIVESLTAADSYRTSGLNNNLPEFDRAGGDGVIFRNFFANYGDSEGGMISLISAVPPLPFPGSTRNLFTSYSIADSTADAFKRQGYSTEVLLTQSIWWNNMAQYLKEIGFDTYRGRDEVPLFKNSPHFTFKAPSDEVLYTQLLNDLRARSAGGGPYFIVAVTVSSHLPWIDPEGKSDDEEHVWRYVDRKFGEFYDRLRESGFFNNGILAVTADHHKMAAITSAEQAKYGDSAGSRIPLFVVGAGIPGGRIDDRYFQQSDLLRHLGRIPDEKQPLSADIIHVERFTSPGLRVRNPGDITVFGQGTDAKSGYKAFVNGSKFRWLGPEPANAEQIVRGLHGQRSFLQKLKANSPRTCDVESTAGLRAGPVQGLSLEVFDGIKINGALSSSDSRFVAVHDVSNVNLPNLHESFKYRYENYALQFDGFLKIDQAGQYSFRVESDDGACLLIGGELVIDANHPKAYGPVDSLIFLEPGNHRVVLRYFQFFGEAGLVLSWIPPGRTDWEVIPESVFRRGIKE